jgi:hypothetical protein
MTCQGVTAASRTATHAEHPCHHAAGGLNVSQQFGDDSTPCNHEHGQTASLLDQTRLGTQLQLMPFAVLGLISPSASLVIDPHVESPPSRSLALQHSTDLVLPLRI